MTSPTLHPHSAHWGAFFAGWVDGRLQVRPHPGDPDPNPLINTFRWKHLMCRPCERSNRLSRSRVRLLGCDVGHIAQAALQAAASGWSRGAG